MNFFDSLIENALSLIEKCEKQEYHSAVSWNDVGYSQVILQRDTAFELSGSGFCLATDKALDFKTVVVGKDLDSIRSNQSFARIVIVSVDEKEDTQQTYDLIKKIEYVKYHFFPDGYMLRSSSSSFKESVRVSKKALKKGISFEKIGNLMLEKYKDIEGVKGAVIYFITDESVDFRKISALAEKNRTVTEALNQVMNNMQFDCASCNLKPICDEVEGMRELHFSKAKK